MAAQAKVSRGTRSWPGSPVEGETAEARKRSCPGPGPGIAKCLPHNIQMGAWGQEKAAACPEDSGESAAGLGGEPSSDSPNQAWRSEAHLNSCWVSSPKPWASHQGW